MDKAEQVAKSFDEIYSLASRHIASKIERAFDSYRRNHGLTEIEARRILDNVNNLSDIRELKQALQNTTDSEELRQLLILLDSAPYASRIERYERLQQEVDKLAARLYKAEKRASKVFYDEFIPDAYYHSLFDLHQQAGVAFAFNRIDPEDIRAIQQQTWLGANYSQRIWGNTQQLADELQKELAVSLLTGRSSHETADAIDARFNKGKHNARRLVRTEANHFHAEMEAKAYEEADVEYYRFLATLDLRTSSICREHDGKIYKVSERVTGKNYPPLHPWCRSDTIASDDPEWLASRVRSARDPETGKTIQVPAGMIYDEWYDKYVKPKYKVDNLDIWEIERASNQYEDYTSILGDKAPKSLEDYIDLKYNNKKGYERLKDRAYIQEKFNDGAWLDKINPEKQARHTQSTAGKNKSYFYDNVDVNALYETYKMTGKIRNSERGRTGNELIDIPADLKLGRDVYTGKYINGFTIKYGKTGSHLIPTYHEE